jgi:hypothetical protein
MKSAVFWVVTPCISERGQRFEGTYCLHFQGPGVSQARHQQEVVGKRLAGFLPGLLFDPEYRQYGPPKCAPLPKLHGVTAQKTVLFNFTIYLVIYY